MWCCLRQGNISAACIISKFRNHEPAWETKFLDHSPENKCPLYVLYKFHSPKPIFHSSSSKCTHIGERVSVSFPDCEQCKYSFIFPKIDSLWQGMVCKECFYSRFLPEQISHMVSILHGCCWQWEIETLCWDAIFPWAAVGLEQLAVMYAAWVSIHLMWNVGRWAALPPVSPTPGNWLGCRLIHRPSLVAVGLSLGYQQYVITYWYQAWPMIGWPKYRLGKV